ncbi:uncharacterized protein LOC134272508 [Saccostrea cucullata]|uniref:uncharacterized protein LOC134272508 n=1 Tax=Saccostrea cuccullata TaxID=36930 RepID=UPI002ED4AE29
MRVVPLQARTNIVLEKGIYVDENSRSCKSHFQNDILTQTAMSQIEGTNDETYLNRTDIADLLQRMRQSMLLKARLDFENPLSLSDEDYYYFTGLSKNQFFEVLSSLTSLRNTSVRSKRTCLAILLVILRTGLSNNLLAVLFSLKKSQIQRSIHAAKNALIQDYVPKNLGFQHIDHDTFAQQHTTPLAKTLFTSGTSNSAVLIMDVDRGFRDSVDFLTSCGLQVEMPCFLRKGSNQHCTEEANLSRLITKVRWVVESVNGRIKNWKLLDKVISNHYVSSIGDFVRIVCSLCNNFRPPLSNHNPEGESIAKEMLERSKFINHVKALVEENNLIRKRNTYINITEENETLDNFPKLSLDDLRQITFGIYQLKQAQHYTAEHIADDGLYSILLCKDLPDFFRVKIQSRHSNHIIHNLWIQYSPENSTITGWYCTCKSGARVVGTCGHVASVLWYLGYKRHVNRTIPKAHMVDNVLNAEDLPQTDSDSDAENEEEVHSSLEE